MRGTNKTGSLPDLLLVLGCSLLAALPLLWPGPYIGADLTIYIAQVSEYSHLLQAGVFPVRWGTDFEGGYGYPVFNFFPPAFLLITSAFTKAGLSVLPAIKLSVLLLTVAGGVGMFLFASVYFGRMGALLTACLYVFAPYHLTDVFVRTAFAEFTATMVVPFVFFSLARLLRETRPEPSATLALTLSCSVFLLSHNLSVIMYAPLLLFYSIAEVASRRRWRNLWRLAVPLSTAFALTAFYTLPMLWEKQFVQLWLMTLGRFNVVENFLTWRELADWWLTYLSLAIFAVSLGISLTHRDKMSRNLLVIYWFFTAALVLLLFMVTSESRIIWSHFEILKLFQFPWRLLSPVTFMLCFLSGTVALLTDERIKKIVGYGLIALGATTFIAISMHLPQNHLSISEEDFTPKHIQEHEVRATIHSEYLPIWVKEQPSGPVRQRISSSRPDAGIQQIIQRQNNFKFRITTPENALYTAHLYYFPGWKLYVNGEEVKPNVSEQGLMQFYLPGGQFLVDLKFENTPIRIIGNSLSIFGLLIMGMMIFLITRPAQR